MASNGLDDEAVETENGEDAVQSKPLPGSGEGPNIPEPPPDMPPDWGEYESHVERDSSLSEATSGANEDYPVARQALLRNIEEGMRLRHVEVEERQELKTKDGDFRSLTGELSSKLLGKRITHMQKSRDRLSELSPRIDYFKNAIRVAQSCGHKFEQLSALLQEIKQFQQSLVQEDIPEDALVTNYDWPVSMICTLSNIEQEMGTFKENIQTCVRQEHCIKMTNQPISHTHLISSLSKLCISAKSINKDETFSSMISYFSVNRDEIRELVTEARLVALVLIAELVDKSFVVYANALEPGLSRIEQNIRVKNACFVVEQIVKLCQRLESFLNVPRHARFSDMSLNAGDLRTLHLNLETQMPSGKQGPTLVKDVSLQDSRKNPPPVRPRRVSTLQDRNKGVTEELKTAISAGDTSSLPTLLDKYLQANIYTLCEGTLAFETISSRSVEVLDIVMEHREGILSSDDKVIRKDYTWMFEAFNQKQIHLLSQLVNKHKIKIDIGPVGKEGNTLFYSATRKFDYELMIQLLELGANPSVLTEGNTTPLHYLAMKQFSPGLDTERDNNQNFGCLDFSNYVNNQSLSDVTLVSKEGQKFYAHRLLLCSQSPVFKSMFESGLWESTPDNEHSFPTIRSQVLSHVLNYIYTGDLVYPHDDLTMGVELLCCAQQLLVERLQRKMEKILSKKIDNQVVLELYQAAVSYGADFLFNNCCYHLLMKYSELQDPNHACLLHLFSLKKGENSKNSV